MTDNAAFPSVSPIVFDGDGPPRSALYDDVYFSREDGLAETRAVFLRGCGLPDRWRERRRFVVGELGFGTGLNIAALLQLWRETAPPGGHLSIFSVEAHPIAAAEAARALAAWPELADLAALLVRRWPGRRAGFHRLDLPELSATLDVAVMDAADALAAWRGRADAWFLDGFAPARNPAMWDEAVMRRVAERSAPGAVAATYTIAGQVRRGLAAAGFAVERKPGFGAKRERLEARLPDAESGLGERTPRIAIVGAGIAGASLARAFAALGATARVFDAAGPGAGASGNPAALVMPGLDAGLGAVARLHAAAFERALRLYDGIEGAVIARGALQIEGQGRDAARFAKIAGADLFEPGRLRPLPAEEAGRTLGEPAPQGLAVADAPVLDPAVVLAVWSPRVTRAEIGGIVRAGDRWRLQGAEAEPFDVVCLAAGAALSTLWPAAPIVPVRGQLNWAVDIRTPIAAAWGGYVAATRNGLMFGATHDRGETSTDRRPEDDARNLQTLAARLPRLAARLAGASIDGRASIRATTSDSRPLAGEIAPGLMVLGGLGSRGFGLAPLLAEHIAALALDAPSPLPAPLAALVEPGRFAERARRRGATPEGE